MRRTWVKFYCDQWLRGSIRKERIEVRALFADLLAMAGDNAYGEDGMIQLAEDVGFSDELIAGILNVPIEIWLSVKERLSCHPDSKENRIEVIFLHQGFAMKILNWRRYQSEYQRQKPYRLGKKKENTPQTPLKERNDIDVDIEGDIEEKVTKVTEKVTKEKGLPPIPKNLDFKIQDKLKEQRAEIRKLKRIYSDRKKRDHFIKTNMQGINSDDDILKAIALLEKNFCQKIDDFSD